MSTVTPDLLPDDIFTAPGDVPTPAELLAYQAIRIEERTSGRLKVELAETDLEDRTVIRFTVIVPAHEYRCVLFEVIHRPKLMLPASFVPPEPLPAYLRERYVQTSTAPLAPRGAQTIENQWIANTPSEFQSKLHKLLASQEAKALLASLIALSSKPPETDSISKLPTKGQQ